MSDCIFCKIINGDFGTEFVYENESESHRIARNGNHRFSRSGVAEE